MDYSDMNYYDICELISSYKYTLPVVADDLAGNKTVLTDGWTEVSYDFQAAKMHYFKLITYFEDGSMQEDYFSADGIHSVHVIPART